MFSFLRRLNPATPSIEVADLAARLSAGSIRVLDVREEYEFKSGHVPGALNVPVKKLPDKITKLKHDKPYAVICQSGNRSRGATNYLLDQGFEGAVSVKGGTSAWARSGKAVIR